MLIAIFAKYGKMCEEIKKKLEKVLQPSPLLYPDPGSNRDGSESTGV